MGAEKCLKSTKKTIGEAQIETEKKDWADDKPARAHAAWGCCNILALGGALTAINLVPTPASYIISFGILAIVLVFFYIRACRTKAPAVAAITVLTSTAMVFGGGAYACVGLVHVVSPH